VNFRLKAWALDLIEEKEGRRLVYLSSEIDKPGTAEGEQRLVQKEGERKHNLKANDPVQGWASTVKRAKANSQEAGGRDPGSCSLRKRKEGRQDEKMGAKNERPLIYRGKNGRAPREGA